MTEHPEIQSPAVQKKKEEEEVKEKVEGEGGEEGEEEDEKKKNSWLNHWVSMGDRYIKYAQYTYRM